MFAQGANTYRLKYIPFTSISFYIEITIICAFNETICFAVSLKAERMHFNEFFASFYKKYIYILVQ
jgi:hypothetical protein